MSPEETRTLAPPGERASAVLDEAHVGDIRGAFGTVRVGDMSQRRGLRQRALTLAAVMGPGLIVMVGDNDAGGVATYSQAGQNYGSSLLWVLVLLIPVLVVNQEMVVRLGAVTGVGHARLINERFGRFWGLFSVFDLFLLNFMTIVTEFIGVSLASSYFGITPYLTVPIAALLLVAIALSGNFERWERAMFVFLGATLLLIPLAVTDHVGSGEALRGFAVPGIEGGLSSNAVLLVIAIVGTTVAPWQLFFQQSNVVDKRITPRWMGYERADTVIGAVVVVIGAAILMMASAHAFGGTSDHGGFTDAGGTAAGLAQHVGRGVGAMFALVLLDASIIGASAVTLSTSYAFGDAFGIKHSLHRGWRDAKVFYGSYAGIVFTAAAITLVPHAPLGVITTAVQALAGILLPSATVFLLLLCNDPAVLGPWTNRLWLNALAAVIVAILLDLSAILVISTVFPGVNVGVLLVVMSAVTVAALAAGAAGWFAAARRRAAPPRTYPGNRLDWRMPPLSLLEGAPPSRARFISLAVLSGYLVLAILLLIVKAVEVATGH